MRNPGTIEFLGVDCVHLQAPDGACAVVTPFGAQVVSWIPVQGDERIFLSCKSMPNKRAPIRGGVPIAFPQFANYGPLLQHGLVRTRDWHVLGVVPRAHDVSATFRIEDDIETREVWPHAFACELKATVGGSRLDIELGVENIGSDAFGFGAALHTYIRVEDIRASGLQGLQGTRYRDRTNHDRELIDHDDALAIKGEVDRIYIDAPRRLTLNAAGRSLRIHAEGFPDVVVWNPWEERCRLLPDMPNDGYEHMLCVEAAAAATPVTLGGGEKWVGRQTLIALD